MRIPVGPHSFTFPDPFTPGAALRAAECHSPYRFFAEQCRRRCQSLSPDDPNLPAKVRERVESYRLPEPATQRAYEAHLDRICRHYGLEPEDSVAQQMAEASLRLAEDASASLEDL